MELLLNPGELLDLGENLQAMTIICHSGTCWLTQAGDSRDYILRHGQQFKVHNKGKLILQAGIACRLQFFIQEITSRHPLVARSLCNN